MQTRRSFLRQASCSAVVLGGAILSSCFKKPRPNILWIIAEDICPDMQCYGNSLVQTPHIDRLAAEGILYTNCFTTNPVCSPSRSALMTGLYQTSIGAHHHRSHRQDENPAQPAYRLAEPIKLITEYFRQAGYHTSNVRGFFGGYTVGGKTDWNFAWDNPFDGQDWNERAPEQPFYAQINMSLTHRVFKRDPDNPIDPAVVEMPPYYVDHPLARRDWADYLESIQVLDRQVGDVLKRLEDEGLLDQTIIFFFGDNGRPHFRGKQWLYDPGIHVPLIIRFPSAKGAGQVRDDLISAIDISATSLSLAGIKPPNYMHGQVFLGKRAKKRDYIIAARDRCDETMDRIRCVRSKRYKYIRNYYPERPYAQLNRYKETQYPVLRLMRRLAAAGELNEAQARFFASMRPEEEFYDLQVDPFEIHNLAGTADVQGELKKLRAILEKWIQQTGDQGEEKEDPAIATYYEQKSKANYNERLAQLYREEGMDVDFIK
ncbi:sulfatase [candidate division KSB1 bacterium]|nr:sulfatase [candidate division KSB1 bacterium]